MIRIGESATGLRLSAPPRALRAVTVVVTSLSSAVATVGRVAPPSAVVPGGVEEQPLTLLAHRDSAQRFLGRQQRRRVERDLGEQGRRPIGPRGSGATRREAKASLTPGGGRYITDLFDVLSGGRITLRDTEEHTREQLSELAKWADLRRNASFDARGLGPPSHVRGPIEPVMLAVRAPIAHQIGEVQSGRTPDQLVCPVVGTRIQVHGLPQASFSI